MARFNTNTKRDRKTKVSGPPKFNRQNNRQGKTAKTQTSRGTRVEPKGAKAGGGPTPDAKMRQKVLNRNQDARRNRKEHSISQGGGGGRAQINSETGGTTATSRRVGGSSVSGPPPPLQRPNGTPPGQPAPQRGNGGVRRRGGGGIDRESEEFRNLSRPEQIKIERREGRGQRPSGTPPGQAAPQPGQAGDNNVEAAKANFDRAQASGNQEFIDAATNRLHNTRKRAQSVGPGEDPTGQGAPTPEGQSQAPGAPQVAGPPKIGDERRQETQNTIPQPGVPGTPMGPPSSNEVASSTQGHMDAAGQDQVRASAEAEAAGGQMPEPPGQVDASGNFQPEPGMNPQDAANSIQAQTEGVMAEQKPEPAMPKSPLGADSPIEQADAGGKLRAGTRHHMRALGFQSSGMDPKTAKNFERQAVRDFDQFGEYPGMDDPHSPPPPIRVGKHSINPMTGQFVTPEGQISVLDRMAPQGAKGPSSLLTADSVRKGEV